MARSSEGSQQRCSRPKSNQTLQNDGKLPRYRQDLNVSSTYRGTFSKFDLTSAFCQNFEFIPCHFQMFTPYKNNGDLVMPVLICQSNGFVSTFQVFFKNKFAGFTLPDQKLSRNTKYNLIKLSINICSQFIFWFCLKVFTNFTLTSCIYRWYENTHLPAYEINIIINI